CSNQVSKRSEVEVQVRVVEAEVRLQLVHPLLELHERHPQPLHLVVAERAAFDAPERLALHDLAKELDQCQDELREPALELLRVRVDPPRQRVLDLLEAAREVTDVAAAREHLVPARVHAAAPTKLYGGHGPVQTTSTP